MGSTKQTLATIAATAFSISATLCCAANAELSAQYGPLPEQTARICMPPNPPSESSPAVLLIHGGGWTGGESASLLGLCRIFARAGVAAATLSYRLADTNRSETRWPAQLDDVRLAANWLRSKSKEFHLDPNRICAYGESAGAHLALWLGITDSRVACIIDAFGPSDLTALPRGKFDRAFTALFGAGYTEDKLREASPLLAPTRCWPAVFLVHGLDDDLVPLAQTDRLARRLAQDAAKTTTFYYRGGHSWSGLSAADAEANHNRFISAVKSAHRKECERRQP